MPLGAHNPHGHVNRAHSGYNLAAMVDPALGQLFDQVKECKQCGTQYPIGFESAVCTIDGGQLVTTTADKLIGTVVGGRYTLGSAIGMGGWSSVYQAEDSQLKRPVAVKILHQFFRNDESKIKRFQREAVIAASLSHPHITTMFDFGLLPNGQPYIVMEYLHGLSLDSVVRAEKQLPRLRAVNIMGQICLALDHAHKSGLVHRDLKPGNIFLLESDFVKVLDFGLAKSAGEVDSLTTAGSTFGTPLFMSPEQCRGSNVDNRTDIYSLGTMLYFMLTGETPFTASTMFEAMHKQIAEQPKTLSECRPDLIFPAGLEAAVARCLSKDPCERFQNCLDLKTAINAQFSSYAGEDKKQPPSSTAAPEASSPKPRNQPGGIVNHLPVIAAVVLVIVGLATAAIIGASNVGTKPTGKASALSNGNDTENHPGTQVPSSDTRQRTQAKNSNHASNQTAANAIDHKAATIAAPKSAQPSKPVEERLTATKPHNAPARSAATNQTASATADKPPANTSAQKISMAGPSAKAPARHIQAIVMYSNLLSDDDAIAKLSAISDCEQLHIGDSAVTERTLQYAINNFPSLRLVSLTNTQVTDRALPMVAASNLNSVNLSGTRITDKGLDALRNAKLRNLIASRDKLTDAALKSLSNLKLNILIVRDNSFSDRCGESLEQLTGLRALSLAHTGIGDATVSHLASLTHLIALDLTDTQITDACIQYLAQLPDLEELSVSNTAFSDAGLQQLAACKRLKRLDVTATNLTSAGLAAALKITPLEAIRVGRIPTPDMRRNLLAAGIHIISPAERTFNFLFMHAR